MEWRCSHEKYVLDLFKRAMLRTEFFTDYREVGYPEMTQRFVLLGTTGYHPNDQRQTACMMLPELGIVLDAGSAMYRVTDYLETDTLDIFLTHAHLDHVVGLTFLYDVLAQRALRHVRVHAVAEKLAAIRDHLFAPAIFPVQPPCEFVELVDRFELEDGGCIRNFPLEHPGGSVGYRFDWPDRSLAYVTDTVANTEAEYVSNITGVDTLLHECYFSDEQKELADKTGHSVTTEVAKVAAKAGVGRLFLVHMNPLSTDEDPIGLATAQSIFAKTELTFDRMELKV